jgi:hypothetical protein
MNLCWIQGLERLILLSLRLIQNQGRVTTGIYGDDDGQRKIKQALCGDGDDGRDGRGGRRVLRVFDARCGGVAPTMKLGE